MAHLDTAGLGLSTVTVCRKGSSLSLLDTFSPYLTEFIDKKAFPTFFLHTVTLWDGHLRDTGESTPLATLVLVFTVTVSHAVAGNTCHLKDFPPDVYSNGSIRVFSLAWVLLISYEGHLCPPSFGPLSSCYYLYHCHWCSGLASITSIPMDVDRRQPIRRVESAVDLTPFESVRQGLAENNTVGWQLAPASIELATRVFHAPEAQRFLGDFLHQVTGIMLDQVRVVFESHFPFLFGSEGRSGVVVCCE